MNSATLRFVPQTQEAEISHDNGVLCFVVKGVEVYRLTKDGMIYKGQLVEDAGHAYELAITWFNAVAKLAAIANPQTQTT